MIKPKDIKARWIRFLVIGLMIPFAFVITLIIEIPLYFFHGSIGFCDQVRYEYRNSNLKGFISGEFLKSAWETMIRK